MAGWLLPFVFLLAIPIGVARVAGGSGCFVCTWGSHAHCLGLVFLRIEALQGSLPDIKCETDVVIVFSRKMKILNCDCLSWWELR